MVLVNVPLAGAAMIAALVLIGRDPPMDRKRAFDLPGALTVTGAVTLIVLALVQGPAFGWISPLTIGILVLGLLLALLFILIERRSTDPLLPFAMLRKPWLMLGDVIAFLFMATFGALLYLLSIFFQDMLRYDALSTALGLAFLVLIANQGTAGLADVALRHAMAEGIADVAHAIAGGVLLMLALAIAFQAIQRLRKATPHS